ncbi:hypothetical protein BDZ97DRAFT_767406 [Flammula alnicola]|nr:hypothetical protein BDZ97DRAFT_767406 [Flammula alnicola]
MRFSAIAAVLAGAGIAQVAAVPIRVILVSSSIQEGSSPLDTIRFGHGVEQPPAVAKMMATMKGPAGASGRTARPCRGRMSRFRQKGIEVSNAFRKALGLPLIEANPHPHVHVHPVPIHHEGAKRPEFWMAKGKAAAVETGPNGSLPVHHHNHHHHMHNKHHGQHRGSFVNRLHYSLVNLGRWEGRAVAFVLGCGIGVLLRMFWVLTLVMYRAVRGQRRDENEYSHITTIFEEYEPAPPNYTFPVDEKVAIEPETKVADSAATPEESSKATAEESK